MSAIRLALVDDHVLFREGLRAVLNASPDFQVVAEASNADQAYKVIREAQPDLIVLDVMLPGISGISIARELMRENPQHRLLALSMVSDEAHVGDAFEAGVRGYACKTQSVDEVMDAIRAIVRGGTYVAPQIASFVVNDYRNVRRGAPAARSPIAALTAREREIFELTVAGMTARAIAQQLTISPRTVETHRSRILRKMDARSVVDLVRIAANSGLLPS